MGSDGGDVRCFMFEVNVNARRYWRKRKGGEMAINDW